MGGSYKQCSQCGKRALSVATRCPGCGHEFPSEPIRRTSPAANLGRFLPLVALAGLLLVGALSRAILAHTGRPAAPEESSAIAAGTREETSSVAAAPRLGPTTPAPSPKVTAAAPVQAQLIARTWTKVRNRRSTKGEVEAVLLPGDTVVVDSLSRGWWRVALEGEVLGYAHESTLVTDAAAVKP
jgi:septal ring-binding cell division protein DamX